MGHMIYNNFVQEAMEVPGAQQLPRPTNLKDFETALLTHSTINSPKGDLVLNTRNNINGL